MELARNVVDMQGKHLPLDVITGKEIKLNKNGLQKMTPNNNAKTRLVDPIKNLEDYVNCVKYLRFRISETARVDYKNSRAKDLLLFLVGTSVGLRVSDLLELTWRDFFYADGKNFKDSFRVKEKKTGNGRTIWIPEIAKKAIEEYLTHCPETDTTSRNYIFQKQAGGKVSDESVNKMMKMLQKECALVGNFSTHSLRKTYAYQLYNKTNNLALVQEMLNHSSIRVTRRYLGLDVEEFKEATNMLDQVYREAIESYNILDVEYEEVE